MGIIEKEYMQGQAFADVLNRFNADYGNTSVEWIADTSRVYPYVASTYYGVNAGVSNVHRIVFMLDCIESGCLTESEERMLGQFNNYRMGTNEFEFVTDESGAITNTAWLEFAASLEQPNADRDPVHWESSNDNGPYKKFSADEAYDGDYVFKLMPGEAQEETTEEFAYAFFGKGIDYDQTIIELISYDGETVENKGSQIDMMSYSGGSQPISLRAGKVMQIFSRNPVTTDGSDFKGWKVRAEMTFTTNETELKKIAFAGMDIPVDGDGYFSLGENWESLNARFEKALGENANALTESRSIALAIFPAVLQPNDLSVSDISEDDFKTSVEKKRELLHAQICDRYAELVKHYPNVKPYRLISNIAMQFNRSVPNIRAILIANKLYPNKK